MEMIIMHGDAGAEHGGERSAGVGADRGEELGRLVGETPGGLHFQPGAVGQTKG